MEVFVKCAGDTTEALVYASNLSWLNTNLLSVLQAYKNDLEIDVAHLSEYANQLWAANSEYIPLEPEQTDGCSEIVPPCSFWPQDEGLRSSAGADLFGLGVLRPASRRTAVLPWSLSDSDPAVPVCTMEGTLGTNQQCPNCGSHHGLAEWESLGLWPRIVSSWCLTCGWSSQHPVGTVSALAEPLLFLTQVLLSEILSCYRNVLRLVTSAIEVLLSRLKLGTSPHSIATSQRGFFTHHGAHPPRVQPLGVPGLLVGRVFQFRFAT